MSGYDLHVPPEISSLILCQLPVKSILRFRCVCKTWYSLISSPCFVSDHSAQTLNHSTSNRVLVHRHERRIGLSHLYSSSFHDESFVESHEHPDIPEQLRNRRFDIVGSCNGLVCLYTSDRKTRDDLVDHFMIWNPSIGKLVELPPRASLSYPPHHVWYLLGFGFDSHTSDYKVLRIGYDGFGVGATPIVSEIFDLRKGVWRSISPPLRPIIVQEPCVCVYLNGNLHWIGNERFPNSTMLSFNLSTEVFLEMSVPGREDGVKYEEEEEDEEYEEEEEEEEDEEYEEVDGKRYEYGYSDGYTKIFPINGLLSVALFRKGVPGCVCSVWSMKEYGVTESWTRLFCIDLTPFPQPYMRRWLDLLRFWENGQVLLVNLVADWAVEYDGNYVMVGGDVFVLLYNSERKKSEILLSTKGLDYVCFYNESLVLL